MAEDFFYVGEGEVLVHGLVVEEEAAPAVLGVCLTILLKIRGLKQKAILHQLIFAAHKSMII